MTTTDSTLRTRLKRVLAARHARLDTLFSSFDLTTRPGLTGFLAAHRTAFAAIRPAPGGLTGPALLTRMIDAIDADLATLDAVAPPPLAPLQLTRPEAQDYVLLGSRLGSQLLRRRWAAATDPALQDAGRYLTLPPLTGQWRRFCDGAEALGGSGTGSDAIIAEAGALFDLFVTAGHAACKPPCLSPEWTT